MALGFLVGSAAAAESGRRRSDVLGPTYPLDATASFPAALLHWMDSLAGLSGAGLSAGKTRDAHMLDFKQVWGRPSAQDRRMLERFATVRYEWARDRAPGDPDALTLAFFEAAGLEQALERTRGLLEDASAARDFEPAVRHFAGRYRRVWRKGRLPAAFIDRIASDPRREAVGRFLLDVARFYGAPPDAEPRPLLIVTGVRRGWGTHAQALGHCLLLEVRPGEGLLDELAPIVHENAHLLEGRMPDAGREALARAVHERGDHGREAWRLLREALPTAIAQGVGDARFRPDVWSSARRWYHRDAVDAYAKRIYPLVRAQLDARGRLDVPFLMRLIDAFAMPAEPDAIPRSP